MNYQIIFRPEAESDLKESFNWYEEHEPGLGPEFLRCIDATLETVSQNPAIYQKVYKNIRRALTRRFPYGIFYTFDSNKIIVLAIFHAKREPAKWKARLIANK